jgi:pilus assembly protein Flp/PilA
MGEAQQALGLPDAAGRRAAHRLVARLSLTFSRLCADEGGATAVEYGLIVACITLAILGGMQFFAGNETAMYNHISTTIVASTH